jgi:hypothetical protein
VTELEKIILTLRLLGHRNLGPAAINDLERDRLNTAADLLEAAAAGDTARLTESRSSGSDGVRP